MIRLGEEAQNSTSLVADWLKDKKRNVILFLGAGMAKESKPSMPAGKEISHALTTKMKIDDPLGVAALYPLDQIAEWYEHITSWVELCDAIEEIIANDRREAGEAYKIAAELEFFAYITTNYDTLLERTLGANGQAIHSPFEDIVPTGKKPIYKAHGTVGHRDKKTFILTTAQYEKLIYSTNSPLASKLQEWMKGAHVVFVGFSLRDPDFLQIYNLARVEMAAFDSGLPRHMAVLPNTPRPVQDFWHRRGISIINSDAKSFFRLLQSLLSESESEEALITQILEMTGSKPRKDILDREMKRSGGDLKTALRFILMNEKMKRGIL